MRSLQNQDMYLLSEIADKMDLSLPKPSEGISSEEYGIQIFMAIIKKIHKAKNEINQLIANVKEISLEEAEKLSIADTISTLKDLFKQDGVLGFFKSVGK